VQVGGRRADQVGGRRPNLRVGGRRVDQVGGKRPNLTFGLGIMV
jgi:hypothetical protein